MAQMKVLSRNRAPSCFFENYACLNDLLVSLEISECVSSDTKSENSDEKSLGALAQNHLKNNKNLNEWCFDGDFSCSGIEDECDLDIDLSFCIKKNTEEKFAVDTSSPESVDSGFDGTELVELSTSTLLEKRTFTDNCLISNGKLTSSKQSVLSKGISAKPKIDDVRRAKLQKIRSELLKKCLPQTDCNQPKYSEIPGRIIDWSNECIITSNFLTF